LRPTKHHSVHEFQIRGCVTRNNRLIWCT